MSKKILTIRVPILYILGKYNVKNLSFYLLIRIMIGGGYKDSKNYNSNNHITELHKFDDIVVS